LKISIISGPFKKRRKAPKGKSKSLGAFIFDPSGKPIS
jgi:hypothetical protein